MKKVCCFTFLMLLPAFSFAYSGGRAVPQGINTAVKIEVNCDDDDLRYEGAIYRVDYDDLVGNGLIPSSVDPRTFKLYNFGQEMAIRVQGETDGRFDSGDYIEFYGHTIIDSRYTYVNAYWLTWDGIDGKRMIERASSGGNTPLSVLGYYHYERKEKQLFDYPIEDPWIFNVSMSNPSYPGNPDSYSFKVPLKDVVIDGSQGCSLSIKLCSRFYNISKGYFRLNTSIAGTYFTPVEPVPEGDFEYSSDIDASLLNSGNAESAITVHAINNTGADGYIQFKFHNIRISYRRGFNALDGKLIFSVLSAGDYTFLISNINEDDVVALDITDPYNVMKINSTSRSGSTFTVNDSTTSKTEYIIAAGSNILTSFSDLTFKKVIMSDLQESNETADYVVVLWGDDVANDYEPGMEDAIEPLLKHRRKQGLVTKVVKTNQIYNEFNYGIVSPDALKDFFLYAYNNWKTDYVLLVGDASFDYRNDSKLDEHHARQVPSHMHVNNDIVTSNDTLSYVASDDWFVCMDGEGDIYPEMFIGRFPARDKDELGIMVDKTLKLETTSLSEEWLKNVLLISGGENQFERTTAMAEANIPENFTKSILSYKSITDRNQFNAAIRSGINNGTLLVNYAGHGHIFLWGTSVSMGAASFFMNKNDLRTGIDDVAYLNNADKYPFIMALSCVNGYLLYPIGRDSMAEAMLRAKDKGAAAMFASSGLTLPDYQALMAEGIFDALFVQGDNVLGSIIARSKIYLGSKLGTLSANVARSFMLFGDPALVLPLNLPDTASTPKDPELLNNDSDDPIVTFDIPEDAESRLSSLLFNKLEAEPGIKTNLDVISEMNSSVAELSVDSSIAAGTDAITQDALSLEEQQRQRQEMKNLIAEKRNFFKRYREERRKKEEAKHKEEEKKLKTVERKNFFNRIWNAIIGFFKAIIEFIKNLLGF